MGAPNKHPRGWFQGLGGRWSEMRAACRSIDPGHRITLVIRMIWLACVPIAVWMAVGEPPWWLENPVVVLLWVIGAFFFLVLGLPPVTLPFALIWYAFPRNRAKADKWSDPSDEERRLHEDRVRQAEILEETGVLLETFELPPKRSDETGNFQRRMMSDPPFLPVLRPIMIVADIVLIIALYADGRTLLGVLYTIMTVGWPLAEGLNWLLLRWRGVPSGH